MGRQIQYVVSLNRVEIDKLENMSKDNKISSRTLKRILILQALNDKNKTDLNYR
jgi:dipeptidase